MKHIDSSTTRCIEQIEAAPQLSQLTMLDIELGDADRCEKLARRHASSLKKLFDSLNAVSNVLGASE